MTGVRCYIDVDPAELRRFLEPLGQIELRGPPGRQVCCELWRVSDGRVLVGGLEQREWAAVAHELGRAIGTFWGGSWAWAWSLLGGPTTGARDFPRIRRDTAPGPHASDPALAARLAREGARQGAERMGDFMVRQALGLTQWTLIEPYHEMLFSVPDTRWEGSAEPVSVALGMATDLPLAFHLDHIAYYGYEKRMASFSTDGRHEWDVTVNGTPLVSARFEPTGRTDYDFDREAAASGTIQPLLGGLRDRRPMLAELRRDLRASGDELHEVEGVIELAEGLLPFEVGRLHRVRSRRAPPNRISVGFRGLEAFVTYPRPAR